MREAVSTPLQLYTAKNNRAPKRIGVRFGVENYGQVSVSVLIRGRRIWYNSNHEAVSSDLQRPR